MTVLPVTTAPAPIILPLPILAPSMMVQFISYDAAITNIRAIDYGSMANSDVLPIWVGYSLVTCKTACPEHCALPTDILFSSPLSTAQGQMLTPSAKEICPMSTSRVNIDSSSVHG